MLRPMGHVNDGGESLLRTPCLGTEASGNFAGGGVTRCGRGDLLSRCGCALRVRAMIARSCLSYDEYDGYFPSHYFALFHRRRLSGLLVNGLATGYPTKRSQMA